MFSAAPHAHHPGRFPGNLYRQVAVESVVHGAHDSHRLVALLFEGALESIAQAQGALRQGDVAEKCSAIGRASRIVEEGLRPSLNLRGGGPLAQDLQDLYAYIGIRLAQANLRSDARALEECASLLRPLAEAWAAIRPQASAVATGA